ncbi:MAG TPA: HdeD family acid-resistance protein [Candidatus Angelobacter sp.]|nr:HdeD family acid-resistance protein [Candidatus Angelobacter sp.]
MTGPLLYFSPEGLRRKWGWFLALGIVLIGLSIVALLTIPAATLAAVLVFGWLLVISGIVEAVHAFQVRSWGGFFLHLAAGALGILIGLMVVTNPLSGALVSTLLFASFFIVFGVFRIVAAMQMKYKSWGWAVFDGIVTVALGILLWMHWPWSGVWFLGLALGIEFMLRGWSYIMLAIAMRNLPDVPVRMREAA